MSKNVKPYLWLTYLQLGAGMAIFGSATPISKIVANNFPMFLASEFRMLLAAAILIPVALVAGLKPKSLSRRDWQILVAIGAIGMFGFTLFLLYGMRLVSGVVGSIVMSTAPAVTAFFSFVFLHDRLGWQKAAGIALAVAGVLALNLSNSTGGGLRSGAAAGLGGLLVFLAVCSEAGYTLFGKLATEKLTPYAIAGLSAAIAAVLFLPPAAWQATSYDLTQPTVGQWLALLWWGAGTLVLGSILWYRGVGKVTGSTAAGFMGLMPVSALVISYTVLGDPIVPTQLFGFLVVFAGVCLIAWAHARESVDEQT